jgi:hypothetical protein
MNNGQRTHPRRRRIYAKFQVGKIKRAGENVVCALVKTHVLGATSKRLDGEQCKLFQPWKQRSCEDTQSPWHQRFREVPAMVPSIGPQPNVAQ